MGFARSFFRVAVHKKKKESSNRAGSRRKKEAFFFLSAFVFLFSCLEREDGKHDSLHHHAPHSLSFFCVSPFYERKKEERKLAERLRGSIS